MSLELTGDERYSVFKFKKKFFKNFSVRKKIFIFVEPFGSGSSVPVEQGPEPSCASGSIPLPTTNLFFGLGTNIRQQ